MPAPSLPTLVVGFDLDLTLLDTRPGIAETYRQLRSRLGVLIDIDAALGRVGIPLADELARWVPAGQVAATVELFRELYRDYGVPGCSALPGAGEALAAVRALGGSCRVVTAKRADLAWECLAAAGLTSGLERGDVAGELAGVAKAEALRGAAAYVGDHPLDIEGARAAQAVAVAVATGSVPAAELAAADIVLAGLASFPEWLQDAELRRRLEFLDGALRDLGPVIVAFSGGADSAFLLAAAARATGGSGVIAATAVSPSLPAVELAAAREFAAGLGVPHELVETHEMDRDGYRANAGDRCFFCKAELVEVLEPLARRRGARILTGTNADDLAAGFRPGIRSAAEWGPRTPLADARLTKRQVRQASQAWGLPTWNKPAAACLASRIAYGVTITPSRLARVEAAEVALRGALAGAGLRSRDLRVRDLGDRARVEVDAELAPVLAGRPDVLGAIRGFDAVEVDPRGFRSGSMNELLTNPARYR